MCGESTRNLSALPVVSPDFVYQILSYGRYRCHPDQAAKLADLTRPVCPYGHAVGWYLYWFVGARREHRLNVLSYRNKVLSPYYWRMFVDALGCDPVPYYAELQKQQLFADRVDVPRILVYDQLLRSGQCQAAEHMLSEERARLAQQFVGLVRIRTVLSQPTEAALWTLTRSLCA